MGMQNINFMINENKYLILKLTYRYIRRSMSIYHVNILEKL